MSNTELKNIISGLLSLPHSQQQLEYLRLGMGTATDQGKIYLAALEAVKSDEPQTETINVVADTTPGIMLLEAMLHHSKKQELREVFGIDQSNEVKVELKINGVAVPFTRTVEECWHRLCTTHEERALASAKALITKAGLDTLREKLQRAEAELFDVLEQTQARRQKNQE